MYEERRIRCRLEVFDSGFTRSHVKPLSKAKKKASAVALEVAFQKERGRQETLGP